MKPGWTLAAPVLLAACTGAPLPAQEEIACNPCWMHRHTNNRRVVEIRMQGRVELTEDDDAVRAVHPDSYLLLVESGTRRPDRRALYTPGEDRGVRLDFRKEGGRQEPDAGDRAWIREMLRGAVEGGMNAERRAEAIRRSGGVPALLREVERLDGGGARRKYYADAIESPSLRPAEAARILRHAGREIGSGGELSTFLRAFVDRHGELLADGSVREAFFAAAASLRSDGDRARVLIHVLDRTGGRAAVSVDALQAARGIRSDGDKTRVLTRVPRTALGSRGVAEAYRSTVDTIRSAGDRRRALIHLSSTR